jgi:hypothetical protein
MIILADTSSIAGATISGVVAIVSLAPPCLCCIRLLWHFLRENILSFPVVHNVHPMPYLTKSQIVVDAIVRVCLRCLY